jgi:hypothetical protein
MVKSEKREDNVPCYEKPEKDHKILDLDTHIEKIGKRDRSYLMIGCPSGQEKSEGHNS